MLNIQLLEIRMEFYIILWLLFLLLSWSGIFTNARYSSKPMCVIILFLSVFVAFRFNVGTDWFSYKRYYYSGIADDKASGELEPIFTFLRWICYNCGFSHVVFFYIISCLSLFSIYKASSLLNIRNIYIVFFVYISLFFCSFQFNIIRNGAMASCFWLAFAYKACYDNKRAWIWALIGCGFHLSGVVLLLFMLFIDKKLSPKLFILVLSFSFCLFWIDIGLKLLDAFPMLSLIERLQASVDPDRTELYGLSIGMLFNIFIVITSYFALYNDYNNPKFRVIVNGLFIGIIIGLVLNTFRTLVERYGQTLNMATVFLWPWILSRITKRHYRIFLGFIFIIYLFLYYSKVWTLDDLNMVPYSIDFKQLFDRHL